MKLRLAFVIDPGRRGPGAVGLCGVPRAGDVLAAGRDREAARELHDLRFAGSTTATTRTRRTEDHPGCPDHGQQREPRRIGRRRTRCWWPSGYPPAPARRRRSSPTRAHAARGRPDLASRAARRTTRASFGRLRPARRLQVGRVHLRRPTPFDDGADDVVAQTSQVNVDFDLPRPADGGPFAGPFRDPAGGWLPDRGRGAPRVAARDLRRRASSAPAALSTHGVHRLPVARDHRHGPRVRNARPRRARRRGHGQPGPDGDAAVQREPERHAACGHDVRGGGRHRPAGRVGDAQPDVVHPRAERQHPDQRAGDGARGAPSPASSTWRSRRGFPNGQHAHRPVQAHGARPPEAGRFAPGDQAEDDPPAGAVGSRARAGVLSPERGGHDDVPRAALHARCADGPAAGTRGAASSTRARRGPTASASPVSCATAR